MLMQKNIQKRKIKGGCHCQSERKAAEMISYSKMPLVYGSYEVLQKNANLAYVFMY